MADGFPEYKLLQKRLETVEREMASLSQSVKDLGKESRSYRADLNRLVLMVIGDEDLGLRGIVERIKGLEDLIKSISDQRRSTNEHYGAILIGVVLSAVFTLSTLVLILVR